MSNRYESGNNFNFYEKDQFKYACLDEKNKRRIAISNHVEVFTRAGGKIIDVNPGVTGEERYAPKIKTVVRSFSTVHELKIKKLIEDGYIRAIDFMERLGISPHVLHNNYDQHAFGAIKRVAIYRFFHEDSVEPFAKHLKERKLKSKRSKSKK